MSAKRRKYAGVNVASDGVRGTPRILADVRAADRRTELERLL
jgi:hypothetical protein